MGRRENFAEKIARTADLDAEPMLRLPLIEIVGRQRVLVENHQGVNQYSCAQIGVKVSYGSVRIIGKGLRLLQMSKERLVITGCIDGIELCRGR